LKKSLYYVTCSKHEAPWITPEIKKLVFERDHLLKKKATVSKTIVALGSLTKKHGIKQTIKFRKPSEIIISHKEKFFKRNSKYSKGRLNESRIMIFQAFLKLAVDMYNPDLTLVYKK
jgi:hypothetical protein